MNEYILFNPFLVDIIAGSILAVMFFGPNTQRTTAGI
jgi:hypothetical protein